MNLSFLVLFIFTICNLNLISALSYRLPKSVIPSYYSLKLITQIENNTFLGQVLIHINVKELQNSILLHSNELQIEKIYLDQRECKFVQHPKYEMIEIFRKQNEEIAPGHHTIFIKYEGSLVKDKSGNDMGFFRGNFTLNGDSNFILVTDFEPTHARRAFPCFDEPSFKAVFQVTLIAPKEYKALSNMLEYEEFETSVGVVHKFKKTLKMSPYLLAFAVTNFDIAEIPEKYPNVRVFSPGANSSNSEEPLKYARKSIEFYERYLNVSEYMHGKVDLIEYERKLSAATENWGMITMNQGLLSPKWELYDGYQIGVSISHEIAHSWFGNLVTNEWWDDIWLHEGLAVYMSIKAEQELFSDSNNNAMNLFTTNYLDSLYTFDRNKPSNAIVQFLETPSEITKHFNDITYTKAAVIFRMIEMIISEENLKKVLKMYICKFQYTTVNTEDFINLIEEYDPHLRSFLETYLYQNRYPLIQVEEDEKMNQYVLTQKNCAYQKEENFTMFGYKWTIPINYITDLNPNEPKLVWFDKDMEKLKIKKGNESWIKFNYQQMSFYRTVYSESMWAKFLSSLSSETAKMEANEANFLLRESISLYDANVISCEYPIRYLSKQSLSKPIKSNSAIFIFIINMLNDNFNLVEPEAYTKFINHIKKLWKEAGVNEKKIQRFKDLYENPTNNPSKNSTTEQALEKMKNCALWINENL